MAWTKVNWGMAMVHGYMAFIILIANICGLLLKEREGISSRATMAMVLGILMIIAAVLIVGYDNSIKLRIFQL
jgi:L-rhamnose-H+ transport protein